MGQKSKKLDDLPRKNDEFWKEADYQTHEVREKKCSHYFVQIKGNEAKCNKCHMGFQISPQMSVNKGHIYFEKELVI